MGRKRKDGGSSSSSDDDDNNSISMERNEMMKLTKVAKSWDFTCSFCFKKFPSAQAMGGHQNAHRSERLEEKRLFVRDPIAYRKRAFLRTIKAHHSSAIEGGSSSSSSFHAATKMVKDSETAANFNADEIEREKACIQFSVGGNGINFDHNLDLTLKL